MSKENYPHPFLPPLHPHIIVHIHVCECETFIRFQNSLEHISGQLYKKNLSQFIWVCLALLYKLHERIWVCEEWRGGALALREAQIEVAGLGRRWWGAVTWEPYPGPAVEQGGIERHWGGVNPHSPRPSLSQAGHNKPRPPPPASPRRPLTPRLRPPSLGPLCLHPVIICNIYSFWFPRWPLSSPHTALRTDWRNSSALLPPPASPPEKTLKPSANTTWSGKPVSLRALHSWLFDLGHEERHGRAAASEKTERCWSGDPVVTVLYT